MLRRALSIRKLSTAESGMVADAKVFAIRAIKRLGLVPVYHPTRKYMARHRLNPSSEQGIERIVGEPVRTEFR